MANITNDFDRSPVALPLKPALAQEAPVGTYLPVPPASVPAIKPYDTSGTVLQHFDRARRELAKAVYLVKALTHEGSLVVDPFLGSGTTAVACQKLNRRFIGCDVDRKAVEIATARLRD